MTKTSINIIYAIACMALVLFFSLIREAKNGAKNYRQYMYHSNVPL